MTTISGDKILNPKTGRWVKLTGKLGKEILKKSKALSPKDISPDEEPVVSEKIEPSDFVKEKLLSSLEASRKRLKQKKMIEGKYYLDNEHKKACTSGKWDKLKKPFVSLKGKAVYPVYQLIYRTPKDLDSIKFDLISRYQPNLNEVELETNNYMIDTIDEIGILNHEDNLDMEWVNAQNDYIKSLSKYDLFTLVGNCNHSHWWCNPFLRGTWSFAYHYLTECSMSGSYRYGQYFFPVFFQMKKYIKDKSLNVSNISIDRSTQTILTKIRNDNKMKDSEIYVKVFDIAPKFTESFVRLCLKLYCEDLHRIIKNAPPIKNPMKVFRGTKEDIFKGTVKNYYKNKGFISTSFDAFWSSAYTGRSCCFNEIKLLKGVRAVLVTGINPYGGEKEIVLNHKSTFLIRKKNISKVLMKNLTGICIPKKAPILTTEIVVIE
jgi:hypothetical protein